MTGASENLDPYVTDQLVEQGADVVGIYVDEAEKEDVETRAHYPEGSPPTRSI